MRGADDAVTVKVVAQADGDDAGNQRVLFQCTHRLQWHIARRHVNVQHAAQNQLHGAALGTHNHVNAGQVALEGFGELVPDQQQKGDGRQPQAEQQDVERCAQRAGPQVVPRKC